MTWLDQVCANQAVTPAAFRVAYAVSKSFNRERYGETGKLHSWPSQGEIATASGLTRRGVQKCLDALTEAGHLSVEVGGKARGDRSTYEAVIYETATGESANRRSPYQPEKSEPPFALSDELRANSEAVRVNGEAIKGEPPFAHKSLNQISDKIFDGASLFPEHEPRQLRRATRNSSESHDKLRADFDEFYAAYPRHVAKEAARRAFERAVKAGADPVKIRLAAMRFAAERDREPDPVKRERFTPHPATWLNAGRWADEAAPTPDPQLSAARGERPRQRQSALELAFRGRFEP